VTLLFLVCTSNKDSTTQPIRGFAIQKKQKLHSNKKFLCHYRHKIAPACAAIAERGLASLMTDGMMTKKRILCSTIAACFTFNLQTAHKLQPRTSVKRFVRRHLWEGVKHCADPQVAFMFVCEYKEARDIVRTHTQHRHMCVCVCVFPSFCIISSSSHEYELKTRNPIFFLFAPC
jgi:hypothetical protein